MQSYKPIKANDYMSRSRETINNNMESIASDFSGNTFPTSNLIPYMTCLRTDQGKLYRLQADLVTWRLELDLSDSDVTIARANLADNALKADRLTPEHVVSVTVNQARTGFTIVSEENGTQTSKTEELSVFDSLRQQLLDFCFPVGYVMTTASSVNPGQTHGGTWQLITEGTFVVAAGNSTKYRQGATGGEATHQLTVNEMPSHDHGVTTSTAGNHTHTRGTMNITGEFGCDDRQTNVQSGAFYSQRHYAANTTSEGGDSAWYKFIFDAARSWTGTTSENGNHTHNVDIENTGGNAAHNNLPPYVAMYMWQRIR